MVMVRHGDSGGSKGIRQVGLFGSERKRRRGRAMNGQYTNIDLPG